MFAGQEIKEPSLNFILDINTPRVLIGLMLSYLPISDISKIINNKTSDSNLIELQHDARRKFNIGRAIDFDQLLPLIAIKMDDVNLIEKLTQYIRQYFLSPESNPEFFERAIVHLQCLEPQKANEFFSEALLDKSMDVRVVKLIIENMFLIEIKVKIKQVGIAVHHTYEPIKEEDAFEGGPWGGIYKKYNVAQFDVDGNPGWFEIIRHEEPVYIYNWTLLLNALLRGNNALTHVIIVRYFEYIDEILEGLIEFYLSAQESTHELDYKHEELETALTTTASVLAELDYWPRAVSAKSCEILSCSIAEQKLAKIDSLNQLILFAEKHETDVLNLQQFLSRLKELLLNAIKEAHPQLELIDKAIKYLVMIDTQFSQLLLDKAVLSNNLAVAEILVNHNVTLRLNDENIWGDKTRRKDITAIYAGLERLASEAKAANQTKIIEHLQMQARPVILEYKEKEKLIAEIVEKIESRYRSNQDFSVYYWGGKNCPSLENKVVPDGIAQILDEHHSSGAVTQKFNRIKNILDDKHNSIFQYCFWKPKRDPILEEFYCDFNDKVTKLAIRKFV